MKNIKKLRRHIGAFLAVLLLCQQFAGFKTYAGDGNEPACGSNVYEYDGYTVEYTVAASWSGAYNAVITITNTGSETIHNWGFVMETEDTISGSMVIQASGLMPLQCGSTRVGILQAIPIRYVR